MVSRNGVALLVSFLAGAATIIGGLIALLLRNNIKPIPFAGALSFAGGVMLFVSFVELYPEGLSYIEASMAETRTNEQQIKNIASGIGMALFFCGWLMASILDGCLHIILNKYNEKTGAPIKKRRSEEDKYLENTQFDGPHGMAHSDPESGVMKRRDGSHFTLTSPAGGCWSKLLTAPLVRAIIGTEDIPQHKQIMMEEDFCADFQRITRMGYLLAVVLFAHNLPEGISTYSASAADLKFGIGLAVAIAVHNIPEGLCVAVPILFGSGSKTKAMIYTAISGMAEPVGGLLAWGILGSNPHNLTFGVLFMLTAGIMVNVALKELLFAAIRYDPGNKITSPTFLIGMMVMAISLMALSFTEA